jgi:exodeoxyribonuclease V gamma subunit
MLPSVLVTELLDYLDKGFCIVGAASLDQLRVEHPLQPFSRAYSDRRSPHVFTYAEQWLKASLGSEMEAPFVSASLGPAQNLEPVLSIDALVAFLKNPARNFLRERLGLSLARYETELADTETFGLEGLVEYWFKQEYLQHLLSGGEDLAWFDLVKGRGQLPHGEFAQLLFDRYRELLPPFSENVIATRGDLLEPLEAEYGDGDLQVAGRLASIGANALVTCRYTAPKADDLLALWVRHLLLNLAAEPGYPKVSRHLGDGGKEFRLEPVSDPERYLQELLQCYREGLENPLRFYPRSAFAYTREVCKSGDAAKALKAAGGEWFSGAYSTYAEQTNPDFALVTRGLDPLDEQFCATAIRVFAPIVDHLGGKR